MLRIKLTLLLLGVAVLTFLGGCATSGICHFGAVSSNPDSRSIERVVRSLDMENYVTIVNALQSRLTRFHKNESYMDAAHWVRDYAHNLGYVDSRLQLYKVTPKVRSANVIVKKAGFAPEKDRRLLIVCAHLDTKNPANNDFAPGADDNASGVAAVLEIARVLSRVPTYHDIYFIFFGSEEDTLRGSTMYVYRELSDEDKDRLMLALNIDMIGYLAKDDDGNYVEPAVTIEGSGIDPTMARLLRYSGKVYTDLKITSAPLHTRSDHLSFIRAGLPALLTMEGSGPLTTNRYIHSEDDTTDKMDFKLAESILRMNTAFVSAASARP